MSGNGKGFTLMEVLVAVTILALSFMVIMDNFSVSMDNIHRVGRASEADYQRTLALERLLIPGIEKDPAKGDLYVQGSRYQLVVVKSDEGGRLTSLRLEKIR